MDLDSHIISQWWPIYFILLRLTVSAPFSCLTGLSEWNVNCGSPILVLYLFMKKHFPVSPVREGAMGLFASCPPSVSRTSVLFLVYSEVVCFFVLFGCCCCGFCSIFLYLEWILDLVCFMEKKMEKTKWFFCFVTEVYCIGQQTTSLMLLGWVPLVMMCFLCVHICFAAFFWTNPFLGLFFIYVHE